MTGRKQFDPQVALDTAVRTFWQRGYSATSIADLQSAMGISRASLYATYGGKESLFLMAVDSYVRSFGPPVQAAFRLHAEDAVAAIGAVFADAVRRMSDPGLPAGCLIAQSAAELGSLDDASREVVQRLVTGQVDGIREALAADAAAGRIRSDVDADTVAVYLTGVVHSLSIMHRVGTPVATLRKVADHTLDGLRATVLPSATRDEKG